MALFKNVLILIVISTVIVEQIRGEKDFKRIVHNLKKDYDKLEILERSGLKPDDVVTKNKYTKEDENIQPQLRAITNTRDWVYFDTDNEGSTKTVQNKAYSCPPRCSSYGQLQPYPIYHPQWFYSYHPFHGGCWGIPSSYMNPTGNFRDNKPAQSGFIYNDGNEDGHFKCGSCSYGTSPWQTEGPSWPHRPSEKTIDYHTHKVAHHPIYQVTYHSPQKQSYLSTHKPTHQRTHQPMHHPSEKPSYPPTHKPIYLSTEHLANHLSQRPTHGLSHKPTNQTSPVHSLQILTDSPKDKIPRHPSQRPGQQKPTDDQGNKASYPTNQPTHYSSQSTSRSEHKSTRQPTHNSTHHASERPGYALTHKPTQYPTNQISQRPMQKSTYQPTHQPSQRTSSSSTKPISLSTRHPMHQTTHPPSEIPTDCLTHKSIYRPSHQSTAHPSHISTYSPTHKQMNHSTNKLARDSSQRPIDYYSYKAIHHVTCLPTHHSSQKPVHQSRHKPTHQTTHQPTHSPSQKSSHSPTFKPTYLPTYPTHHLSQRPVCPETNGFVFKQPALHKCQNTDIPNVRKVICKEMLLIIERMLTNLLQGCEQCSINFSANEKEEIAEALFVIANHMKDNCEVGNDYHEWEKSGILDHILGLFPFSLLLQKSDACGNAQKEYILQYIKEKYPGTNGHKNLEEKLKNKVVDLFLEGFNVPSSKIDGIIEVNKQPVGLTISDAIEDFLTKNDENKKTFRDTPHFWFNNMGRKLGTCNDIANLFTNLISQLKVPKDVLIAGKETDLIDSLVKGIFFAQISKNKQRESNKWQLSSATLEKIQRLFICHFVQRLKKKYPDVKGLDNLLVFCRKDFDHFYCECNCTTIKK